MANPPDSPTSPVPAAGPRHLLVVDDDPQLRAALHRHLGRFFAVTTAANGREALDKLRDRAFDAIVTDVDMPELDGLGLRREVMERYPALGKRLLLMSGGVPHWLRLDPTMRFITKPFTVDELRRVVEEMIAIP